jgi:hypothetical protein
LLLASASRGVSSIKGSFGCHKWPKRERFFERILMPPRVECSKQPGGRDIHDFMQDPLTYSCTYPALNLCADEARDTRPRRPNDGRKTARGWVAEDEDAAKEPARGDERP